MIHEWKRDDARWLADWQTSRKDMIDQAAIKAADAALRAGLLINGGAAVSVLAFMGSLASKDVAPVSHLSRVADGLEFFAYGVVASVVGLGLSYLTHLFEGRQVGSLTWKGEPPRWQPSPESKRYLCFRNTAHVCAVIAFIVCICLFVWGMVSVRDAVVSLR